MKIEIRTRPASAIFFRFILTLPLDQNIGVYAAQDCPLQRSGNLAACSIIFVNIRFKINFMPCPAERRFEGREIGFSVF